MIDSIKRREFLQASAIFAGTAAVGGLAGVGSASAAPAAKPVSYEVAGRKFEGVIVYDDSVKTRRPVIFMQPDWKGVDADTIAVARTVAGQDYVVLMADMFGVGYGSKPKTVKELVAGMSAVHKDLAFTIACGSRASISMLGRGQQARPGRAGEDGGDRLLRRRRLSARTRALRRDFRAVVVFHVTNPNPAVAGTPPISKAGFWRSTARPIPSRLSP